MHKRTQATCDVQHNHKVQFDSVDVSEVLVASLLFV